MKRVWKLSLGLSLGLFVTRVCAEEAQWRPVAPRSPAPVQATEKLSLVQPPPASPAPPIASSVPAVSTTDTPAPGPLRSAVLLERPVPTRPAAVAEAPVVRPTGFVGQPDSSRILVRGQGNEVPRAMPVGPPPKEDAKDAQTENLNKMPTPLPPTPTPVPLGTTPGPTPLPEGAIGPDGKPLVPAIVSSGPVTSGPVMSGPVLAPEGEVLEGEVIDGEIVDGGCCGEGCGEGCVGGCCGDCCDEGTIVSGFGGRWPLFGGKHFGWGGGFGGAFGWQGDSGWGESLFGGWGEDGEAPGGRFYLRGEYLRWSISNSETPTLVTGSQSRRTNAGAIGSPGTFGLFGGEIDNGSLSGSRLTAGMWFGAGKRIGIEGSGLFFGPQTSRYAFQSRGQPALFRPFFNPNRGEQALRIAFPRQVAGMTVIDFETDLSGAEANMLFHLHTGQCCRLVFLGGYRNLSLSESIRITDQVRSLVRGGPVTNRGDSFATENQFNGGQVGLQADFAIRRFTVGLTGKLAMGGVSQKLDVAGVTFVNQAGRPPQRQSGGLLAMPSNSGQFASNRFTLVPEFGVTVGYNITDWMRLYCGYNLLYIGNVMRPGDQMDRVVNPSQITRRPIGAPRPTIPFDTNSFIAHGFNAGLEFKY